METVLSKNLVDSSAKAAFPTQQNFEKTNISYIKMKVCMCVCMCVCVYVCMCVCVYVRLQAAGPTQPITPKFGMGSSFHPGSAPSQGPTPNVDP